MDLSKLEYAEGARKKEKRIGRGPGSGRGGTSTRGHKGQRSRSGSKRRAWFEGGQMPIQRRLPKRGFTNIYRVEFQVVNLSALQRLADDVTEVTPDVLYKNRLIRVLTQPVKILGDGDIGRPLNFIGVKVSGSAREKIEAAKGSVTAL